MKTKMLNYLMIIFMGFSPIIDAVPETTAANNFENLIKSMPMVVVLFFKGNPGPLEEPFLQASRTPRFRFSEVQFVKAEISQPGIVQALDRYGIRDEDLPIIVLFRDGQVVSEENGTPLGLSLEATAEELRDFIDDYFSDLIEGVMKYSQENSSMFSGMPSEAALNSDFAPDFGPAVIYQPIVFNTFTTWAPPIWWTSFSRSSFFHRYHPGFRPVFGPGNRPRWFRPGRPERKWNQWRDRRDHRQDGRPSRPDGRPEGPGRPGERPGERPGRPGERPGERPGRPGERPERPNRPDQRPGVTRPERPNRPGQRPGVTRPERPNRPDQRPGVTRPERPNRPDQRPGVTRPERPNRPDQRPGVTRPERPGRENRPEVNRPERPRRQDRTEVNRPERTSRREGADSGNSGRRGREGRRGAAGRD